MYYKINRLKKKNIKNKYVKYLKILNIKLG